MGKYRDREAKVDGQVGRERPHIASKLAKLGRRERTRKLGRRWAWRHTRPASARINSSYVPRIAAEGFTVLPVRIYGRWRDRTGAAENEFRARRRRQEGEREGGPIRPLPDPFLSYTRVCQVVPYRVRHPWGILQSRAGEEGGGGGGGGCKLRT